MTPSQDPPTNPDDDVVDAELVEDVQLEPVVDPALRRRVDDGLGAIRTAILGLDHARAELTLHRDFEGLAHGIADIELIRADLGEVSRQASLDAGAIITENTDALKEAGELPQRAKAKAVIDGVGVVEVQGGWDRKAWDSEKLLRTLLHAQLTEDGVMKHPVDLLDDIMAMLTTVLPITPSLSWRVGSTDPEGNKTGLQAYGIDARDWCDQIDRPRLAKVPKRKREAE